jgi:hypothetical protein
MDNLSNYIVFVDESGDHGLDYIDPDYPVFVLSFCIFKKTDYLEFFVPTIKQLKFDHWGHDIIILREHSIRKRTDAFKSMNKESRESFMDTLSTIIDATPFKLIAIVIKKQDLLNQYADPSHVYHLAMEYGLERLYRFMKENQQCQTLTHVIFEARGKNEDRTLELEFRRRCDGNNYFREKLPFQIIIADKKTNSEGLQMADMTARPVGLSVLRPNQPNRAFEILK